MTKSEKLKDVAKLLDYLNEKDLDDLTNEVYNRLIAGGAQPSMSRAFDKTSVSACAHCGSVKFVKNGKDRKGNTRYICRDCGKTFTSLTNTTLCGTRKSADTWKTYVENMLDGRSLEECAKRCGISTRTAFLWRHKILNALSEQSFDHQYDGLMEMDEMFVRISYKGNHKKSQHFVMPREPHKRGTDGHIKSNKSSVSVLCVVERGKGFSGVIPCRGFITQPLLENLFDGKLSDESVVMTDGLRAYKNYLDTTNAQHIILPSVSKTKTTSKKPRVVGPYHINNVNAMHQRFRKFLRTYNGVSTKFLSNYLALFLWMENHKGDDSHKLVCDTISSAGSYVSAETLRYWAAEPDLAPHPIPAA